ncbi:hypothetical protein KRR23_12395 [Pseudomonas sp. CVAP|uniref:hypothetical protein n=1 Tax=Pseudomonas sp. CVAP\|nr:hypothetical protein [Pseudomonas sp. CVAP\
MTPYRPLSSNPTPVCVLAYNILAPTHFLHETACSRVRIGTDLLETLTSITLRDLNDKDFYRLINARTCHCAMGWILWKSCNTAWLHRRRKQAKVAAMRSRAGRGNVHFSRGHWREVWTKASIHAVP